MHLHSLSERCWLAILLFCPSLLLHAQDPNSKSPDLPVSAGEAAGVTITAIAETGYFDEQKRYLVDLLEQDYAYLAVRVETMDGQPVQGAVPEFSMSGDSQLIPPFELPTGAETDEYGVIEFAVIAGPMGLDKVTAKFGAATTEILVNVVSLKSTGYPSLPLVKGGIAWPELMKARVDYKEDLLVAEFPADIEKLAGQSVKLTGFMLPLEPALKQRRFLLTSNPPSCFFHIPGGPAGAVEVFAAEGIEASSNPVVLRGRFEPQHTSDTGVVYRLHDAELASP